MTILYAIVPAMPTTDLTSEFTCRVLTGDDWNLYRAWHLVQIRDAKEIDPQFYNGENAAEARRLTIEHAERKAPDEWRQELSAPNHVTIFAQRGDQGAGITYIEVDDQLAEYTGFYRLESFKGQGVGDALYKASTQHVLAHYPSIKSAFALIRSGNDDSSGAALRNGFVCHGEGQRGDAIDWQLYKLDLDALRAAR